MNDLTHSVLLIGESDVGKTHYGAQLLNRLIKIEDCKLTLDIDGPPANFEPFQATLNKLNTGVSAAHTTSTTYIESIWPIIDDTGKKSQLVWPDYAGEQVSSILSKRLIPPNWAKNIQDASSWMLLIRLNKNHEQADILSKPIADIRQQKEQTKDAKFEISHQAQLVELLQIMLFAGEAKVDEAGCIPKLLIALSCWDELKQEQNTVPADLLAQRLPMFYQYITSTWSAPLIFGVSALGKPLDKKREDKEYSARGPECFGYVITPDGSYSTDLTLPIQALLTQCC